MKKRINLESPTGISFSVNDGGEGNEDKVFVFGFLPNPFKTAVGSDEAMAQLILDLYKVFDDAVTTFFGTAPVINIVAEEGQQS